MKMARNEQRGECILKPRNHHRWRRQFAALGAATAAVLLCHPGQGQAQTTTNGSWLGTGTTSANWSDPTNWVGGVVAGSTTGLDNGTATFNTSIGAGGFGTAATPVLIDQPTQNIGSIVFDGASDNYTIGTTSGNPLNVYDSGAIQLNSTLSNQSAVETVNAPLSFVGGTNGYSFNNDTTNGVLNIGGNINQSEGAQPILNLNSTSSQINVISGSISDGAGGGLGYGGNFVGINVNSGTWALAGTNTYTGPTVIATGATLALESNNALYNTQSLLCPPGSTVELVGNNLNVSNGTEHSTDGVHINNLPTYISNIVNPSGNNMLNVNIQNGHTGTTIATSLTINCSSGFLTLLNNSTNGVAGPYNFIGAGSGLCYMSLNSAQNTWNFNSTGTWNLAAGSLSGQHGIQFPGPWNVNSGTVVINDSTTGSTTSTTEDVLSNSNHFTINTGATLIETATSNLAGGSGIWVVNGGTMEFLGSQTAGGYGSFGGTIQVNSGTFIIGNIGSLGSTSAHFQMTGGTTQGVMTSLATNLSNGQITTPLTTTATTVPAAYNFTGGVSILFNNTLSDTGNQPINLYSGITAPAFLQIHRVLIDGYANANSSTGTTPFTLTGPGNTLINGIIQDGSAATVLPQKFIDSSTGTVTLTALNNYSGGTIINAGLLVSANGLAGLGSGAITINGGNAILSSTSAATVNSMLKSGFNGGLWNGSTGINSTAASQDPQQLHAVGMLQPAAATTFEGQPLGNGDVALKYTYYGDANLDGMVDGSDYSIIDSSYLTEQTTSTNISGWQNGDFNYDGVIDGSDYTLIDNAYNSQGAAISAEIANTTAQIAGAGNSPAVPEPATLGLLGMGAVALLGRGGRHRRR